MTKYVIHRPERIDRLGFIEELKAQAVFDYTVFDAITNTMDPKLGLIDSVKEIIRKEYNNNSVLIFEDDVTFTSPCSIKTFFSALPSLRNDTDFIVGGAHYCKPVSEMVHPLFQMKDFSGTHMILIYKRMFDFFLNSNITIHYDAFLSENLKSKKLIGYAVYPFVAKTINSYSDLRKEFVDDSVFFSKYLFKC